MKEAYIKLPVVDVPAVSYHMAKYYPDSGRYIVRFPNGDIGVMDIILKPLPVGDARPDDEYADSYSLTMIGQPKLYSDEDLVEADKLRQCQDELAKTKVELEKVRCEYKERIDKMIEANDDAIQKMKAEHQAELDQKDTHCANAIQNMKKEFEMEKKQIELEQPKRNGQGEWVSGKTLTDIIRTLVGVKREDATADKGQRVVTTLLEPGEYTVKKGCSAISLNDGRNVRVGPIIL